MKYGYLFYQKPMHPRMKTRPVNLGDPIQSYAVKLLYREMGIAEEDIVPVPRYDMAQYDGEECVCVVNTASTYEETVYDSHFMPPSPKVHAIPLSLYVHREIPDAELAFYRNCGGVGCRDLRTVEYLQSKGVPAYLTGCLTLTLPRRSAEVAAKADKVYLMEVPADVRRIMPQSLREEGIELSNVLRFPNTRGTSRISVEEAFDIHRQGEERAALLRDTARLVITSRLHVASPCLAMGIPVVLAKSHFGDRFGYIDRILPTYTPEHYDEIDWNPQPVDFEEDKAKIKQLFFDRVRAEVSRVEMSNMWASKKPIYEIDYDTATSHAVKKISFPTGAFPYAVWGLAMPVGIYLDEAMRQLIPQGKLVAGIDIALEGTYYGAPIIRPEEIDHLPQDTIIFVIAPSAQKPAKEMLTKLGRPYVLIRGTSGEHAGF